MEWLRAALFVFRLVGVQKTSLAKVRGRVNLFAQTVRLQAPKFIFGIDSAFYTNLIHESIVIWVLESDLGIYRQ